MLVTLTFRHQWTDTPHKCDLNSDSTPTPADAATLAAADVSGDDRVTSLDALMILQGWLGGNIDL